MLIDGVKITRVTEDRKLNDLGQSVPFLRVEFKVDQHGPFVEKFDKATYTPDARDQRLNDFAATVR